ncbi:MAG: Modulator of FtsH protease HflK [Verrucomicrobiota bacterium]|jgi:membrane protease subunit HflK
MSDHPPHDHPHPHGDGHRHDHGHGHHHDHPPAAPTPGTPDNGPQEFTDDAGAQALAEALRRSFAIVKVLMAGLLVLFLFSGFFTVKQNEKAVILRFGKPLGGGDGRVYGPGSHWAFPAPIDEVVRIPVGQVQAVESSVGWYHTTAAAEAAGTEPPPMPSLHPVRDGYLLTGDANIIHARATLRYRIAEPGLRYMLGFADPTNAVRNAFNNALLAAAARYRVDDALTRDQAGFREAVVARLTQLIREQNLGIVIEQIDNLRAIPPRQLQADFARVLEADVRRSKELNDARTFENQTLNQARAGAEGLKSVGEAERTRLVEFVAAEVERFTNNLPAYRSNPRLFTEQRRAESLAMIYTNAQEKIVAPQRGAGGNRTVLLQINREPPKPKVLEQPKADDHH